MLSAQVLQVEDRKLENDYLHALKVERRDYQHKSALIHAPTFWGSL